MSLRALLAALFWVFCCACGVVVSFDEYGIKPPIHGGDAAVDVEVEGDGDGDGEAGRGSDASPSSLPDAAPPPKGPTMYVSPLGADQNDGLSTARPKKTVRAALDVANTGGVGEILVCRGVYTEAALRLLAATSLRGGYDCTTWTRPAEIGALASAQVATLSTLRRAPIAGRTLAISGSSIGRGVIVDGFVFEGPQGAVSQAEPTDGAAVVISDGAGPSFQDNVVKGGAPTTGFFTEGHAVGRSSVGLWLAKDSHALVARNEIRGGAGRGPAFGSIGIYLDAAGSTELTENVVHGGTGSGSLGSAGITVAGTKGPSLIVIRGNSIDGGEGTAVGYSSAEVNRVGIRVVGGVPVTIERNTVRGGGDTPCEQNAAFGCAIKGIVLLNATGTAVHGNHIVVGPGAARTAIDVRGSTAVSVVDNFLHVGNGGQSAVGVVAVGSPAIRIVHNTLIIGTAAKSTAFIIVTISATPESRATSLVDTAIVDNLVVGNGTSTRALYTYECAASGFSVRGNTFADLAPEPPIDTITCAQNVNHHLQLSDLGPAFGTGDMTDNRELAVTCSPGRASCFTCGTSGVAAGTCGVALFEKFDPVTRGLDGWTERLLRLRADSSCAWTEVGAVVPDATEDAFGTPRTAPVSAGAHEASLCVP